MEIKIILRTEITGSLLWGDKYISTQFLVSRYSWKIHCDLIFCCCRGEWNITCKFDFRSFQGLDTGGSFWSILTVWVWFMLNISKHDWCDQYHYQDSDFYFHFLFLVNKCSIYTEKILKKKKKSDFDKKIRFFWQIFEIEYTYWWMFYSIEVWMNTIRVDIDTILAMISKNPAISDLHLACLEKSSYRLNGEIYKDPNLPLLNYEAMEIILKQLFQNNVQSYDKFITDKESDFAYEGKDGTTYRVNAFFETGKISIVMRKINNTSKKLEEMMFSKQAETIKNTILNQKKWLFLVTGPTGSGKSTSIVSMLDYINTTRTDNLITIEDPIEFIFKPNKCIISQRQVGQDSWSFKNALKSLMRQDPDIVFIWEIRDTETAETVLSIAESWHLVFSTLHTSSAGDTLSRFLSFFPSNIQESVAMRLSNILLGVQSQMLVKMATTDSRIGLFELMLNNTAIKNNLKKNDISQVDAVIEASTAQGMITMQQYARKLLEKGVINAKDVEWLIKNEKETPPQSVV